MYYKFFSLAFLLQLLIGSTAFAQVTAGFKAGPALTRFFVANGYNTSEDYKLSYQGGVFAGIPISKRLALQAEVLYSNRGPRIPYYINDERQYGSANLHYVSVPLLLQYQLAKFRLEAGVEAGYRLKPQLVTGGRRGLDKYYKKFDAGLNVGVQYDAGERLMLGLRYYMGLYDLSNPITLVIADDAGHTEVTLDNYLQNRSLQFSVGYKLFK